MCKLMGMTKSGVPNSPSGGSEKAFIAATTTHLNDEATYIKGGYGPMEAGTTFNELNGGASVIIIEDTSDPNARDRASAGGEGYSL